MFFSCGCNVWWERVRVLHSSTLLAVWNKRPTLHGYCWRLAARGWEWMEGRLLLYGSSYSELCAGDGQILWNMTSACLRLTTALFRPFPAAAAGCGLPLCQFLASLSSAEILLLVRLLCVAARSLCAAFVCFIHALSRTFRATVSSASVIWKLSINCH